MVTRRQRAPRWICPCCGRSIPPDVPECYCGTTRAAAEARARHERLRNPPSRPPLASLGGLTVIAVASLALLRTGAPPPREPVAREESPVHSELETAASSISASDGSGHPDAGVDVAPSPPSSTNEPRDTPTPVPVPAESPRPTPSGEPERSEVDLVREAAEKRLEQTFAGLQAEMGRLSANARELESVCQRARGLPGSCRRLFNDIAAGGEALQRGLEEAENDARRAWVSPGVVRDLRRKHGLEESACREVLDTVHRLASGRRGVS
jgi:hypothetical protein